MILGIEREQYNAVDWFGSNELLLNFTRTDYLHFGPHLKKVYMKGKHDMTKLHQITPNLILNEPRDTPENPNFSELKKKVN